MAVAGLHMYGFLSLNVKFGACTIKMLNVALLCRLANGLICMLMVEKISHLETCIFIFQ